MCGIFGFYLHNNKIDPKKLVKKMLLLSETRGRDASGIVLASKDQIKISKRYLSASKYIKTKEFSQLFNDTSFFKNETIKCIGHTRLATNGSTFLEQNNQPIAANNLIGVHNGIITNDESLWTAHPDLKREFEVDTELMLKLFDKHYSNSQSFLAGISKSYKEFEGNISCAVLSKEFSNMILATNNGSLYFYHSKDAFIFASERLILSAFLSQFFPQEKDHIEQLLPGNAIDVNFCETSVQNSIYNFEGDLKFQISPKSSQVYDFANESISRRENLRRCSKCLLPETFPFIRYDENGVCNHCHNHEKIKVKTQQDALNEIKNLQAQKESHHADCLFMLSGGRDSCYALHHAAKVLNLKPIAYTYDWGMVTDIARRNAERMCGKLGIEHIIVSADIRKKRENIRKNILAWLKKPELGMVPIFMAGDKQFLYYGKKIRDINKLPLTVLSACPFEKTGFKTGFAGVDEGKGFIYNISLLSKIKFFSYYAAQFLKNPSYINSTLFDSLHAFWSAYLIKHDFFHTYDYEYWDEDKIVSTLVDEYNWELDPEANTSWRIGDGTAAFYNYIYYTIAGFTENDTFRSHQIREGVISREDALKKVTIENQPRWQSLQWYASAVGFNLSEAINTINSVPKLY